jgi:protease-4
MVDLESYGVRKYPKYKSDFERLMEDFGGAKAKIGENIIKEELGNEAYQVLKEFKQLSQQKGTQARMSFNLNIE